jgi:hypothetical protein
MDRQVLRLEIWNTGEDFHCFLSGDGDSLLDFSAAMNEDHAVFIAAGMLAKAMNVGDVHVAPF